MKKLIFLSHLALGLPLFGASTAGAQELTPNTQPLNISKFYLTGPTGDIERFQAAGFYEPPVTGAKSKLFLMPRITMAKNGVVFIKKDGSNIADESQATEANVSKIKVSLRIDSQLPNKDQMVGVMGQVYGSGEMFLRPKEAHVDVSNLMGSVLLTANPELLNGLKNNATTSAAQQKSQEELGAKIANFTPQMVSISGVRVSLMVDGDKVAEKFVPNTLISSGSMPDLFIQDPSGYTINRIKSRQFQIMLDYAFKDAKVGSVQASFDFEKTMNQMVKEEWTKTTQSKQSGVKFLGFGKRKSKLVESLRESASEKITQDNKANTLIQMSDADDSLIAMFEAKFFPQVTRQQAINAHLEAAKVAESAGNATLAKAHAGYAQALQEEKLDLSVDTAAAMASLAAKDYAGFVAKGVKMDSSEGSASSQYSRVITREVDVTGSVDWAVVKTVSVQRVVTQIIEPEVATAKAYLGLCDATPYSLMDFSSMPAMVYPGMPMPMPKYVAVTVITCVVYGSPLAKKNIGPNTVIRRVGGEHILTGQDLADVLAKHAPGDEIEIETLSFLANAPRVAHQWKTSKVKLGRGMPVDP